MRRIWGGIGLAALLLTGASGQAARGHGHEPYGDGDGYNVLVPAMATGCFGESLPVLRLVFVPPTPPATGEVPGTPKAKEMPKTPGKQLEKKEKGGKEIEKREEVSVRGHTYLISRQADRGPRLDAATVGAARKKIDLTGLTAKDAEKLFGRGYQLFWAEEYGEALPLLVAASELAEEDARFWYYRSLTESALGQDKDAAGSLRQAVDLDVRASADTQAISRALERVQGETRMQIRKALDARRAK